MTARHHLKDAFEQWNLATDKGEDDAPRGYWRSVRLVPFRSYRVVHFRLFGFEVTIRRAAADLLHLPGTRFVDTPEPAVGAPLTIPDRSDPE